MRAKIRGTEIFFDVDGAALVPAGDRMVERPVLFLLHGGPGGDHSGFKASLGALRDAAQLVYIDHRGSGRSAPADPSTYTLEHNVEDVEALRQHLGLERISILGQSYGGMVAQGYATRYPQRVSNLILVVTAPSFRFLADAEAEVAARGTPEQQRVCRWLFEGSFESLEQAKEFFRVMGPMYALTFDPKRFEESWARGRVNFQQLNLGFADGGPRSRPAGHRGFLRDFDFEPRLGSIACPTLVIGAEHDWVCPVRHSRRIAELIPRAHLKVFARSGHLVGSDEPEAYLTAVGGFLTYAPT